MKKVLVAFFASLALALTTVGLGSAANAAYPNTVATKTTVTAKSSVKSNQRFNVTVRVRAGSARINEGTAKVIFGGRSYTAKVKSGFATFKVKAPKVKKTTKKTLKASYKAAGSSVYKASSTSKSIKIKATKKR